MSQCLNGTLPPEKISPWGNPKKSRGATSSAGRFSLALNLEVGREKALASAGHMTTKQPEFVSVPN